MIYIELGRCMAYYLSGNADTAVQALISTYHLTRENNIIMPFVEYGSQMCLLLAQVRNIDQKEIPAEWVEQIDASAARYAESRIRLIACYKQEQENLPGSFGISQSELDVLTYLKQGVTREEISMRMNLSLGAVKTILKQIFIKLGAVNSDDAVRLATMYKLI